LKLIQALLLPAIFVLTACGGGSDGAAERLDFACARVMDPAELGNTLGLTNNANIWLNPNGTAPLSARLQFCTPEPGRVTLTVLGKAPDLTDGNLNDDMCSAANPDGIAISHHFSESASEFDLPVLGLYPNHNNTVVVEFMADSGATTRDELMIMTAPLPTVNPPAQVTLPIKVEIIENSLPEVAPGVPDSGVYILTQQKSAFDQCGEVRWTYRGEGWQFYELLPNGNWLGTIITDQLSYHFRGFSEFTMLGEKVSEYLVPNYLHHEVQKLPSGNYLVASNSVLVTVDDNGALNDDGESEEDTVLEISAADGNIVRTWDFNAILDPDRTPIPSNGRADDWLHINSAVYDDGGTPADLSDDGIIITAQRQSLVAKVGYESGELVWILGSHEGWNDNDPGIQSKLLDPVDALGDPVDINAEFFWPYGPHAALAIGAGSIAIFDNGANRGFYGDLAPADIGGPDFSRGVEYLVDEDNMTVQIVWQFDSNKEIFTRITGDIDYLDNGNYLLGFVGNIPGTPTANNNPRVIEVGPNGNILFDAVSNRGELEYRVEKIDLYRGQ
jgi:arylsulfate sulfotransferase